MLRPPHRPPPLAPTCTLSHASSAARLPPAQGSTLKKVVDSIKDLVENGNLECQASGITLQAMDSAHVALVALSLTKEGFKQYRCDRNITLGVNMGSVGKIMKCLPDKDSVSLKADAESDQVTFLFEGQDGIRVSEFQLKLMEIDGEHMGIPDTEYKCSVQMPSGEFKRIITDLAVLGDTCRIAISKDGIKFSVKGDIGTGSVQRKQDRSGEKESDNTNIEMEEATDLEFALRYLVNFTKATSLSPSVALHMSKDVPLMVEYKIPDLGYVRFYLAPKIAETEGESNS